MTYSLEEKSQLSTEPDLAQIYDLADYNFKAALCSLN